MVYFKKTEHVKNHFGKCQQFSHFIVELRQAKDRIGSLLLPVIKSNEIFCIRSPLLTNFDYFVQYSGIDEKKHSEDWGQQSHALLHHRIFFIELKSRTYSNRSKSLDPHPAARSQKASRFCIRSMLKKYFKQNWRFSAKPEHGVRQNWRIYQCQKPVHWELYGYRKNTIFPLKI